MPSLNALGEFKFSFSNIGNERTDLESKNRVYPDIPLPDKEAAPMDFPVRNPDAVPAEEAGGFDFSAFLDTLPGDINAPPPIDDIPVADTSFSMDDLLGGIDPSGDQTASDSPSTDDLLGGMDLSGSETADEASSMDDLLGGMDLSGDQSADQIDSPSGDSFSTDDLLGGMDLSGGELETAEEPIEADSFSDTPQDTAAGDFGSLDMDDFNLGDPGSADDSLTGDNQSFDESAEESSEESAEESSEESAEELQEIHESIDLGGEIIEPLAAAGSADEEVPAENIDNIDNFDDFDIANTGASGSNIDLGGETIESADTGSSIDTTAFDTTEFGTAASADTGGTDTGGSIDLGGESDFPVSESFDTNALSTDEFDSGAGASDIGTPIDLGDFGADFASESIDLDLGSDTSTGDGSIGDGSIDDTSADFSGGGFASGDFELDGIDDIFEKTKIEPIKTPQKKSFWKRKKTPESELPEVESDIEEIQLTQSDVDKLVATITSYPLNLRIACEELIAEQVILPQQLSKLIRYLIGGAHVKETAALVEEITGKPVIIPKSYEKMTGAAFEAEQASFAYIFVHNFLPVFRLFAIIAAFAASVGFLGYTFIYIPIKAENLYKRGYERIPEGEYQRANHLFDEAFNLHRKKKWFYLYAEAFRDQRSFVLAEEKYDQLLGLTNDPERNAKAYPRDKKGVLDYAHLNTYYLLNYDKANRLLHEQLLHYAPNDYEGLLAAGDNFLLWADSDPERFYSRYEDARFSYARLLELRGWQVPVVERMLKFFIRTDNLKEVLYLRYWFESDKKRKLSPLSLAELAGYLLDKQLEEVKGVPDPYLEGIESVRAMLLEAISENHMLPEPHYHLARYHKSLNNMHEERLALENAIRAFDIVDRDPKQTETVQRRLYRADTHFRYSNLLVNSREFFPAEEQIIRGIELYEDYLTRNLIRTNSGGQLPKLGEMYAAKGDLEYFVKSGNMEASLRDYHTAERYGYAPPEIQYRMGFAYYHLENWGNALEYLFKASADLPLNRRLLYALGNAAYRRNDYFAAQGYYSRLLDILDNQRVRLPVLLPNNNPQYLELGERLMMANNNMGVVYEALADQTGNREYRSRALYYYMESANAWDAITRNPETMTRMILVDTPGAPSVNQGYLNVQNATRPNSGYAPQIFPRIDKDVLEPSRWEELAGPGSLQ